ncbi:MAG TPA: SDR family oxidoreductase [Mycobacteriales bacterium]|nr:SDR family oxidoreductase [Mycobacteriales bacterium]
MTRSLEGQVVAVTGAARGLGAELARQATARGARLALLGLEPEVLAEVASQCPGSRAWEVDVTDGAALARVAEQVVGHFGRVDVVVANAGVGAGGPLLLADPDAYDRVLEVNLLGSIRTVRAFLPHVVASRGYVLQVASVAAIVPVPMMSAYCASKSGVEAFAHALRAEVAHHGVRVGVAYLSWTDSDMVRGADATPGLGEFRAQLPGVLGRTYAMPPAAARIVDGIAARRRQVYAQPWLRVLPGVRGGLPWVVERGSKGLAAEAERALRQAGVEATRQVGAGGVADRAAQQ